jgi:GNAT superfamily N-acetyltransferase
MYHTVPVKRSDEQERFCALPGLSVLSPEVLDRQRPDASWMLVDQSDQIAARCSLWWRETPPMEGHRLGFIGHYAAHERGPAAQILRLACARLAEEGCSLAVAPIDGNTWQRYRLLTERGPEPLFFLEPDNPDDWPGQLTGNGFAPLAEYYSAVNTDLGQDHTGHDEIARQVAGRGITIRSVDLDRFADELRALYALSAVSFRDNFLYTPIGEDDFVAQYRGIRPYVKPELVLLAERSGELVGFLFNVPDMLQAQRGQPIDTVIFKTMAVDPAHRDLGLGRLLIARGHLAARELGFRRAVHALMYENNRSRRISGHTARVIRRYTLFARPLGASP